MTPIIITTYVLACACLTAVLLLTGLTAYIAVPVAVALTLLCGWAYRLWRKSVEVKLFKSLSGIMALKGITPSERRDCVYWPERELLSVIVDKSSDRIHFIDYRYFGGVKNYYSYAIDELGCVAPYLNYDAAKHPDNESPEDKKRAVVKKRLAIEIRGRNPDQPGAMRDIQLYPISKMRLFMVPFKREDDDMFVFATHAASLAMDAISAHYHAASCKA